MKYVEPGVKKFAAIEVVPHWIAVNVAPQLLDNNSIAGLVKLTPILLRLIVGFVVCATNLYHTSYAGVTAQSPLIVAAERVAPYMLPVTLIQVVAEFKVIAVVQLSLAGGGSSTQIVKFPVATVVEKTLTK
jgi:hypothetical protein